MRTPLALVLVLCPLAGCADPAPSHAPHDAVPESFGPALDASPTPVEPLDLSDAALLRFETGTDLAAEQRSAERGVLDYTNFAAGATSVVGMAGITGLVTGPAAQVLGATYEHGVPAYLAWNRIAYTHTVVIGDYSYEAVLTTTFQWSSWDLELVVDLVGPSESLLGWNWLSGTVGLLGNEGDWVLRGADGATYAEVEYLVDPGGVFVAVDGSDGASVTSDVTGGVVDMTLVEADGAVTSTVWDLATLAGSVLSPYYAGGAQACWDAALINTPCGS